MNKEEAKIAQQGLVTLEKAGSYLCQFIDGPLGQVSGIIEDRLRYSRLERKVRLFDKATEFLKRRGLNGPTAAIPLKIALPLLEAGSIEDDNDIQDIYAQILANAADETFELKIKRTYIDVLQNLSGLEIDILRQIYSLNFDEIWSEGVWTTKLPTALLRKRPEQENLRPPKDVEIALANMFRLGLINRGSTYGGAEIYSRVTPTLFGQEFVQICGIIRNE